MKVYGIGGLGVDERVFTELRLEFELVPLPWIEPQADEPFTLYAARFAKQMDTSEDFTIIGVSFGGMLAVELSKILRPTKIILVSSASNPKDIPLAFRLLGRTGLMKLLPEVFMKPPTFITNWFFAVREPRFRKVLSSVIADTDLDFLRWATSEIATWNNEVRPDNIVRIHGAKDRLLGWDREDKTIVIPNAGHFMIMDQAKIVSDIINDEMRKEE